MYLMQCVEAYGAVLGMMQQERDYVTAHALLTLKRKLEPHCSFFAKEEMKLEKEFAQLDERGEVQFTERGTFRFRAPELAKAYAERRTELGTVEVQEEFPALRVPPPEKITPAQLEALEPFVQFGAGGGGTCR